MKSDVLSFKDFKVEPGCIKDKNKLKNKMVSFNTF